MVKVSNGKSVSATLLVLPQLGIMNCLVNPPDFPSVQLLKTLSPILSEPAASVHYLRLSVPVALHMPTFLPSFILKT